MAAPVVHFEIIGSNGDRLKEFYKDLFDWNINSNNPMNYGLVEKAGNGIGGGIGSSDDGGPGHVTFYVEVDDLQASLDKIEATGGKTILPITEIPNMVTFALFTDPEGNMVGLVKSA